MGEHLAKDMISARIGPGFCLAVVDALSYLEGRTKPAHPKEPVNHTCINFRLPSSGGLYAWEFEENGREFESSKIHAVANAEGKPLVFIVTPGNVADISVAACLLDGIAPPRSVLADEAYDADHLRKPLEAQGTEVVIPSTYARRMPHPLNRRAYRGRNVIERMLGRMKDWRRIATRYDRLARNFLSAIALVATACFWLT